MLKNLLKCLSHTLKDCYHYIKFPQAYIAYRGVFGDFASASRAIPKTPDRGLDYNQAKHEDIQEICASYAKTLKLADTEYPLFFWLDRILAQNPHAQICDFGGSDGRHYFAYTSYSELKPKWHVCELESCVALGNHIAQTLQIPNLCFSQSLTPAHVLLSSSAFQYIENLYELLREYLTGGGRNTFCLRACPCRIKPQPM